MALLQKLRTFKICKADCADFIREYVNDDYKLFQDIIGKILIHSGVSTPRQVKKIVNTFIENVMIGRDREQAGKVVQKFATEKVGLQTIAKISVLQSDYNEFYDLLFKDVNAINEIIDLHRNNGKKKPSELLENYFDNTYILLKKYESLVNYLIFTEHLGHTIITPYLYMTQTKEGVIVGDKKQQDFMSAIESCNFVTIKQLIHESPILSSLFVEQLKYNESSLMGNIVLSAIDCYQIVPENEKEELAIAIVERIPEFSNSLSDFRYDLINEKSLIDVCRKTNSNEYNRLIECAINNNQRDGNYENKVKLISKVTSIKCELLEGTKNKFENYVKEWISSEETRVHDIINYVAHEELEYIADICGIEYVKKISRHITGQDDFDDALIKQFGNLINIFLNNHSLMEIIDIIKSCYDYPVLHGMLNDSIDEIKYGDIDNLREIALKIVSIGTDKLQGEYGYQILTKLSYKREDEDVELFDKFFTNTVTNTHFADMIEALARNNTLDLLTNAIDKLNTYVFDEEGYQYDIGQLLKYYTSEQSKVFWRKLRDVCKHSSHGNYSIICDLY